MDIYEDEINGKLLSYLPKKNRIHIVELSRESAGIHFVMAWEDGFQRSKFADSIAELKELVAWLEEDREARI